MPSIATEIEMSMLRPPALNQTHLSVIICIICMVKPWSGQSRQPICLCGWTLCCFLFSRVRETVAFFLFCLSKHLGLETINSGSVNLPAILSPIVDGVCSGLALFVPSQHGRHWGLNQSAT